MLLVAALFGWTGFLMGYALSETINVASGSAIVVACVVQFFVVLVVAPRYGLLADWLRRRRLVPTQIVEDVLGSVYRAPEHTLDMEELAKRLQTQGKHLHRAVRSLERRELLRKDDDNLKLTTAGKREALRLIRAHRLWETYLARTGMPTEQLHAEAHRLEHVHDEDAVDYLDDKLGHPLRDPHGSEIPEDFVHLVPGAEVKAALLREGHTATITALGDAARELPINVGMRIVAGPRRKADNSWRFRLPDGSEVLLNHHLADAVTVKLDEDSIALGTDSTEDET